MLYNFGNAKSSSVLPRPSHSLLSSNTNTIHSAVRPTMKARLAFLLLAILGLTQSAASQSSRSPSPVPAKSPSSTSTPQKSPSPQPPTNTPSPLPAQSPSPMSSPTSSPSPISSPPSAQPQPSPSQASPFPSPMVSARFPPSYPPPALYPPSYSSPSLYPPSYASYPPAYATPSPSPPPPPATQPSTAASSYYLPMDVSLVLSNDGCAKARDNLAMFQAMMAETISAAWNAISMGQAYNIQASDIQNINPTFACGGAASRLLLQTGGSTVTTSDIHVGMPQALPVQVAANSKTAFESELANSYNNPSSSSTAAAFTQSFGVSGATVTVKNPVSTSSDDSSDSHHKVALGVGLGIGLGIPVVALLVALAVFVVRRKANYRFVQENAATTSEAGPRRWGLPKVFGGRSRASNYDTLQA